jgi:hypothetical protein
MKLTGRLQLIGDSLGGDAVQVDRLAATSATASCARRACAPSEGHLRDRSPRVRPSSILGHDAVRSDTSQRPSIGTSA